MNYISILTVQQYTSTHKCVLDYNIRIYLYLHAHIVIVFPELFLTVYQVISDKTSDMMTPRVNTISLKDTCFHNCI